MTASHCTGSNRQPSVTPAPLPEGWMDSGREQCSHCGARRFVRDSDGTIPKHKAQDLPWK